MNYERNGQKMTASIQRDEIKIPDVPYQGLIDNEIGYIKLTSFTQTASEEVGKAIRYLEQSNLVGLESFKRIIEH